MKVKEQGNCKLALGRLEDLFRLYYKTLLKHEKLCKYTYEEIKTISEFGDRKKFFLKKIRREFSNGNKTKCKEGRQSFIGRFKEQIGEDYLEDNFIERYNNDSAMESHTIYSNLDMLKSELKLNKKYNTLQKELRQINDELGKILCII